MANKKLNQLVTKPSIASGDLFPIADATTGQLYKTTISDLGTAIGSGVSSVNGLVGAVVLDTDDIQELASPVNKWFTDLRARAANSVSSPLAYNNGTGLITIAQATGSANGYLSSTDWTTFNSKQAALSGTGFVKISGTTISYDNSTYLTTSAAATNYVPYTGATANVNLGLNYSLTAALIIKSGGTSTQFLKADGSIDTNTYLTTGSAASTYLPLSGGTISGDLTISSTNPRIYLTDIDNNPDYFISNTDGTFTIYDVTSSVSRFTLNGTTGTFGGNLTVGSIIKSGGTSSQFLKADGSVDSTAYVSGSGTTNYLPRWSSSKVLTDSFVYTNGNYTEIQGQGLTATMGIVISGRYGSVANAPKIYSSDETTGVAHIELVNGGGEIRLGVEKSTGGQILPGSSAYATVLTAGLSGRNLEFGTNNTKRMTISGSTGAVTLTGDLSGTSATFTSSITAGNTSIFSNGSGLSAIFSNGGAVGNYNAIELRGGTAGTAVNWQISKDNSTANAFELAPSTVAGGTTYGSPVFKIVNSGAATFSSSVTASGGLTVGSLGSGSDAIISLANNASGSPRTIYYKASTATINFTSTGGGDLVTITNGGNVGIGTSSPANYTNYITQTINGTNGAIVQLQSSGTPSLRLIGEGVDSYLDNVSTGALIFRTTSSSSERMRITSGGQVLINQTSGNAAAALEVTSFGAYANTAVFNSTTTNPPQIYLRDAGGAGKAVIQSNSTIAFNNGSGFGETMRIASSGGVSIGTTSDTGRKFSVAGTINVHGANNAIQTISKSLASGGTASFTMNSDYGYGLNDNISGLFIVSISEPTTDIASNSAVYVGTINNPRGNGATITQISKTQGSGILLFTVTNSSNDIVVSATAVDGSSLRACLTFIGGGGTN